MVAEAQLAPVVVSNPQMAPPEVVEVEPDTAVSTGSNESQKKNNRIQVSNTKKPLFFYLNLAKRYIKQYDYVELSALGMAIPTAVTISEILKANGVATEMKILTSTVGAKDENKGRIVQKAKLEILLERCDKSANQKSKAEAKTKSAATQVKKVESEATVTDANVAKEEVKAVEETAPKTEERVAQLN